jgi:hypothetical protein
LRWRQQGRGAAHGLSLGLGAAPAFGGTGADKVALNIGQPAEYRQHQAPGAGASVGPWLCQGSELRLGVHDAFDDAEQIKGAAGQPVDPRDGHQVAGGQLAEHPVSSRRSGRAPVAFSR